MNQISIVKTLGSATGVHRLVRRILRAKSSLPYAFDQTSLISRRILTFVFRMYLVCPASIPVVPRKLLETFRQNCNRLI